jgi:hypothetical protein
MSQQEEYQRFASKFVDLWQNQMAAMLNDGEFIRALLAMMQGSGFSAKDDVYAYPFSGSSQSPGGAAAASDARDAALAHLAYSLAAIEKRLEAIERAADARVSPVGGKAKRSVGKAAGRPAARKRGGKGSAKTRRRVS